MYSGSSLHYPSYARAAVSVPCPLCGGALSGGADCSACHAPGEVIESILGRGQPPRFLGVLGPSGAGKTVYLGMLLDLLARGADGLHGIAHGPSSMAVHRNVILALERQRFPAKTPSEPDRWQWVHCEVMRTGSRRPVFDIVTPDVAGEAVMAELEHPRSNPTIRALLVRCAGLVVLIDTVELVADGQAQELFAMQLISYLAALRPDRKGKAIGVPVALVFTKSDLCAESADDPDAFARANAPGLARQCASRLARYRFFSSAVAGATGRLVGQDGCESLVPLRVEPRGVLEPFTWLLAQIR